MFGSLMVLGGLIAYFLAQDNIPLFDYTSVYSPTKWHIDWFQVLAIMKRVLWPSMYRWQKFSVYLVNMKSITAGLYDKSMLII